MPIIHERSAPHEVHPALDAHGHPANVPQILSESACPNAGRFRECGSVTLRLPAKRGGPAASSFLVRLRTMMPPTPVRKPMMIKEGVYIP